MLTQLRISFTVCILLLWCPANLLGQAQPPSGQGVRNDCMSRSDDAKQDQANRCYDFEPIRAASSVQSDRKCCSLHGSCLGKKWQSLEGARIRSGRFAGDVVEGRPACGEDTSVSA